MLHDRNQPHAAVAPKGIVQNQNPFLLYSPDHKGTTMNFPRLANQWLTIEDEADRIPRDVCQHSLDFLYDDYDEKPKPTATADIGSARFLEDAPPQELPSFCPLMLHQEVNGLSHPRAIWNEERVFGQGKSAVPKQLGRLLEFLRAHGVNPDPLHPLAQMLTDCQRNWICDGMVRNFLSGQ
jgi:hypothetical protein